MNKEYIDNFTSFLRKKIEEYRDISSESGEGYGGGNSPYYNKSERLKYSLECWLAGLHNIIPETLREYAKEFELVSNSEYQEYIKLKKKFENIGK